MKQMFRIRSGGKHVMQSKTKDECEKVKQINNKTHYLRSQNRKQTHICLALASPIKPK